MSKNEILKTLEEYQEKIKNEVEGYNRESFDFNEFYLYLKEIPKLNKILIENNYFKEQYTNQETALLSSISKVIDKHLQMLEKQQQQLLKKKYNDLNECVGKLSNKNSPTNYLKLSETEIEKSYKIINKLLQSSTVRELKNNLISLPAELNEININLWDKLGYTDFYKTTDNLFESAFKPFIADEIVKNTFIYADAKDSTLDAKLLLNEVKNVNLYKFDINDENNHRQYETTFNFFSSLKLINEAEKAEFEARLNSFKLKQADVFVKNLQTFLKPSERISTQAEANASKRNYSFKKIIEGKFKGKIAVYYKGVERGRLIAKSRQKLFEYLLDRNRENCIFYKEITDILSINPKAPFKTLKKYIEEINSALRDVHNIERKKKLFVTIDEKDRVNINIPI